MVRGKTVSPKGPQAYDNAISKTLDVISEIPRSDVFGNILKCKICPYEKKNINNVIFSGNELCLLIFHAFVESKELIAPAQYLINFRR